MPAHLFCCAYQCNGDGGDPEEICKSRHRINRCEETVRIILCYSSVSKYCNETYHDE